MRRSGDVATNPANVRIRDLHSEAPTPSYNTHVCIETSDVNISYIMEQTGCKDETLVAGIFEDCDYDLDYTISVVLQMACPNPLIPYLCLILPLRLKVLRRKRKDLNIATARIRIC